MKTSGVHMGTNEITLDLKWGWKLVGYLASIFVASICSWLVIDKGMEILARGGTEKIISLAVIFFIGVGAVISILYFYRSHVVIDENRIRHIGLFTVELPFSEIEKVKVDQMVVILSGGGKSASIGTWQKNYQQAVQLIEDKLRSRTDLTFKGKSKHFQKHFEIDLSTA